MIDYEEHKEALAKLGIEASPKKEWYEDKEKYENGRN
jgi:hypothetical protein